MIHRLAIPTPFRVGPVNCYLIEDDPLTLVDVGPNSAESLVALEAALAEHGRRIEDLDRVVITHQHTDHLGLVGIVADRSGAEVCALDLLAPIVEDFNLHADLNDELAQALMARHGIAPRRRHRARRDVTRLPRLGRERAGLAPPARRRASSPSRTAPSRSTTARATPPRTRCSSTPSAACCSPATT